LAGKGTFTLFTGLAGKKLWARAVGEVKEKLGLDVKVITIGIGGEWVSMHGDWEAVRGVEEDGCVLVRPDRFVGWRCKTLGFGEGGEMTLRDARENLGKVMRHILFGE
jgi:hypothetical protein